MFPVVLLIVMVAREGISDIFSILFCAPLWSCGSSLYGRYTHNKWGFGIRKAVVEILVFLWIPRISVSDSSRPACICVTHTWTANLIFDDFFYSVSLHGTKIHLTRESKNILKRKIWTEKCLQRWWFNFSSQIPFSNRAEIKQCAYNLNRVFILKTSTPLHTQIFLL